MPNLALIGAGRIGAIHGSNVAADPKLTLTAIVDPNRDAADALARATGAVVCSLETVLADPQVEGVIIASPTGDHLDQVRRCAAAGKAILCEKPVDLDLARARSAAMALKGARLLIGFNRRFDPRFAALKAAIDAREFGLAESLHITSHDPAAPPRAYVAASGGLFKDMAIHDFDMARWLLGEEFCQVFAAGACLVDASIGEAGDVDTAKTLLRSASGRLCAISNSRRSGYGYDQRIEAFGSAGMLRVGNLRRSAVERWGDGGAFAAPPESFFLDRYRDAYRLELAHFAQVLEGVSPKIGYADAVAALALAEAAQRSAATGLAVRL